MPSLCTFIESNWKSLAGKLCLKFPPMFHHKLDIRNYFFILLKTRKINSFKLNNKNKSHCLGTEENMPGIIENAASIIPKHLIITPIPMDKKPYLVND